MNKLNCIIVDDEPLAREILVDFAGRVPFLKVTAQCKNAFEAMEALKSHPVELIFLDIQMPDLTGIQLYQSLAEKPMVIFTTAYSNHAVEGFEVDAVDYLVKPFSFQRFVKAVNKAEALRNMKQTNRASVVPSDFIFVKDGNKTVKIVLGEVQYLEGMKDYVKIVLPDRYILTLISMQKILDKLPADQFVRIHRSYIVPLSKIDRIERNRIVIGEKWIPIGKNYKEDFFERIQ